MCSHAAPFPGRIDEMGTRIDQLEQSLGDLMAQVRTAVVGMGFFMLSACTRFALTTCSSHCSLHVIGPSTALICIFIFSILHSFLDRPVRMRASDESRRVVGIRVGPGVPRIKLPSFLIKMV